MTLDAARFQKLLGAFKLEQLFNELGWDNPTFNQQTITANGETFTLTRVCHQSKKSLIIEDEFIGLL